MAPMSFRVKRNVFITVASLACLSVIGVLFLIGWLVVMFNTEALYGYVNNQGHFVIAPKYFTAGDFENGEANVLAIVRNTNLCDTYYYGVINRKGNVIHQSPYTGDCFDSLLSNSHFDLDKDNPAYSGQFHTMVPTPERLKIEMELLSYHYESPNSDAFIPPKFTEVSQFSNGVAWASSNEKAPYVWGLINRKGDYLMAPKCLAVGEFHEGLAYCRVNVILGKFY